MAKHIESSPAIAVVPPLKLNVSGFLNHQSSKSKHEEEQKRAPVEESQQLSYRSLSESSEHGPKMEIGIMAKIFDQSRRDLHRGSLMTNIKIDKTVEKLKNECCIIAEIRLQPRAALRNQRANFEN